MPIFEELNQTLESSYQKNELNDGIDQIDPNDIMLESETKVREKNDDKVVP
jgi:hypothetical protein